VELVLVNRVHGVKKVIPPEMNDFTFYKTDKSKIGTLVLTSKSILVMEADFTDIKKTFVLDLEANTSTKKIVYDSESNSVNAIVEDLSSYLKFYILFY
jgi:hypothetical protein